MMLVCHITRSVLAVLFNLDLRSANIGMMRLHVDVDVFCLPNCNW